MTESGDRGAACERLLTGQVRRIRPLHWPSAVVWRGLAKS